MQRLLLFGPPSVGTSKSSSFPKYLEKFCPPCCINIIIGRPPVLLCPGFESNRQPHRFLQGRGHHICKEYDSIVCSTCVYINKQINLKLCLKCYKESNLASVDKHTFGEIRTISKCPFYPVT